MIVRAHAITRAMLALLLTLSGTGAPIAAEGSLLELKWDHLIPPSPPKPRKPSFLPPGGFDIGSVPDDGTPLPTPLEEGRWMSVPRKSRGPAPVVESLDGQRVHIGGYVVPLDFAATTIKEFLLVPFVGACIHVPAPPSNQIIYVKTEKGFDVQGSFDAVYVTGTLKVMSTATGLADAGYSIEAEKVEIAAH
jgi:uncharacterized protein